MRPVTLRARGHPAVRALHPKTIELTTDASLTERGTCIVGVAAELDPGALADLRGRVTVTLDAGGRVDVVRGIANPAFDAATGRLVIRRSRHRAPDTLVYAADKGAADLDRAVVDALQQPGAELRVTIEPAGDAIAHTHVSATLDLPLDEATAAAIRVADEVTVDASERPPLVIAAVLAGAAGPVTLAGPLPRRAADRRVALATQPDATTVWEVAPADVARAAGDAGDRLLAIVLDPGTPDERVLSAAAAGARAARQAVIVVGPGSHGARDDGALLAALLRAGVAPRTLQDALVAAYGIPRRDAFARVVAAKQ